MTEPRHRYLVHIVFATPLRGPEYLDVVAGLRGAMPGVVIADTLGDPLDDEVDVHPDPRGLVVVLVEGRSPEQVALAVDTAARGYPVHRWRITPTRATQP